MVILDFSSGDKQIRAGLASEPAPSINYTLEELWELEREASPEGGRSFDPIQLRGGFEAQLAAAGQKYLEQHSDATYVIAWDDGDTNHRSPSVSQVRARSGHSAHPGLFAIGDLVEAEYPSGNHVVNRWYPARIVESPSPPGWELARQYKLDMSQCFPDREQTIGVRWEDHEVFEGLVRRIFGDLKISPSRCKVLCTEVLDSHANLINVSPQMDEQHGMVNAMRHFQPEPTKAHFLDQTSQRICKILFETFHCAAFQIVPPVLYSEIDDRSSAQASWDELVWIAQALPNFFPDPENQFPEVSYTGPFPELSMTKVPWVWYDIVDCMRSGIGKSDSDGLEIEVPLSYALLAYGQIGPTSVTLFQPRGRLTDCWEET